MDLLRRYLGQRSRPENSNTATTLFTNSRGQRLTRHGVAYILQRTLEHATLHPEVTLPAKLSPHTIRHTTAMQLLRACVDSTVIAAWLGHVDLRTTHQYVEIDALHCGHVTRANPFSRIPQSRYEFMVGDGARTVAMGDFNEDGHQDLAVVTNFYDDVTVLLNNQKEIDVEVDCPTEKIPQGESLPIHVMITNRTDFTINFEIKTWVKPVGGEEFVLKDPHFVSLNGGKSKDFSVSLTILENLSLGDYILTLEAMAPTDENLDEDSFRVRVVGSRGGKVAVSAD